MKILNIFSKKSILNRVQHSNKIKRLIIYFVSCFIVALTYNVFFVKHSLVIGGMSGLAIVFKKVCGLNTSVFLMLSTIIMLIISFIIVGKKEAMKNVFCAINYPIFVSITEPISKYINIEFSSYMFTILFACIIYSTFLGLIYKVGYSTGGTDIINQIICKYAKTSVGTAGNYINILIIFTAACVFGISQSIYAIFALIIDNKIVDFIMLGNSDSKLCIIKSKHIDHLERFLEKEFNIGYSILESTGGVDLKKRKTIFCVVTSREYYRFKNLILDIDSNAFIMTHDCYEVMGGNNKRLLKL